MDGIAQPGRKRRIFRRVEEKLRIVKLTLEPGASVASIALANGVNANQVFRWKRQYERNELQIRRSKPGAALVPVTIAAEPEAPKLREISTPAPALPSAGSVTIEFPGRVTSRPAHARAGREADFGAENVASHTARCSTMVTSLPFLPSYVLAV
jgi:transposase